ncbi:phosphoenolpyruvate-utilizing N-terminal domain-containing protein, partial [Staphylococcus pettenkoferi]|uniref:phosphoenolpyruvate-utilizing N-terminal domain-containing protein n=1 Tax=Staphylococcus pettenkoferi TaxID=170573 RepID=UPI003B970E36
MNNFPNPIHTSKLQLTNIPNNPQHNIPPHKPAIFDPHLLILHHPQIIKPLQQKISNQQLNPPTPFTQLTSQFLTIFHSIHNQYIKHPPPHLPHLSKPLLPHILALTLP